MANLATLRTLIDNFRIDGLIDGDEIEEVFNCIYDALAGADSTSTLPWDNSETYDTPVTAKTSGNPSYVDHLNRFWRSKTDGNNNNEPPTDTETTENTNWIEVSPSNASPISDYTPGLYGDGLIIVHYNNKLLKLNQPLRPFESVDVDAELVTKDWVVISDSIITFTAEVLDANPDEIVVTFSEDVNGDTITGYGTDDSKVITGISGTGDTRILTVDVDFVNGQTVALSYVSLIGQFRGERIFVSSQTVSITNNVGAIVGLPPTNIIISSNNIDEGNSINDPVGTLSADGDDPKTWALVAGTGDDDNSSFSINVDVLEAEEVFDFATKSSYSILVQAINGAGNDTQQITIDINAVAANNFANNISFQYDDTAIAYLANDPLTAEALAAGSLVISVSQVAPDLKGDLSNNANTGLAFDPVNDRLIVNDFENIRIYDINDLVLGNEISSFANTEEQGIAVDPINELIFTSVNASQFNIYNYAGTLQFNVAISTGFVSVGGMFYDYFTGKLYITEEGYFKPLVFEEDSPGVWSETDILTFTVSEQITFDYISEKIFHQNGTNWRHLNITDQLGIEDFDEIKTGLASIDLEGLAFNSKNGLSYLCFPEWFHGGETDGNRIWVRDLLGNYNKKVIFPDTIRFSDFSVLTSAVSGIHNREVITGVDWNESPVFNTLSFTLHQSIGNWDNPEAADLEWRGSATPPDLSAATLDNISTYDGWGTTVPSAWQASPVTSQYWQVRIRPTLQTPVTPDWQPEDIVDIAHSFRAYSEGSITNNPYNSQLTGKVVSTVDYENEFSQTVEGQRPTFNVDQLQFGLNNNFILDDPSALFSMTTFELVLIVNRYISTSRANYFSLSNSGSNNNWFSIQHQSSSDPNANEIIIKHQDNAGTLAQQGFLHNVSQSTNFLISIAIGGGENEIYLSGVKQTLTDIQGTNTGQNPSNLVGLDSCSMAHTYRTSSFTGVSGIKFLGIIPNRKATTGERGEFVTWATNLGLI